jgi:hypothetical protein
MYKIIGADRKEYGPISADQIRQWIAEGRINANTQIQADGGPWKSAAEFPELAAALGSTMPPTHASPIAMAPAVPAQKANLTAVWALIVGIMAIIPCCWGICGIVSIVLGCVGLSQIKRNPQQGGTGMAIAGIVLGAVSLFIVIVWAIVRFAFPQIWVNLQNSFQ